MIFNRSKNKYGAIKTKVDGINFPSGLEAGTYLHLKAMVQKGELSNLRRQPVVRLTPHVKWKVDFVVFDEKLGRDVWCEAKGMEGERYKVVRNLWRTYGPGLLRIYKGTYQRPKLVQEIMPVRVICEEEV